MPWNLLILPLAAAYYMLTRCLYFKFKQERLDRQRLLFEAILLGIILLLISVTFKVIINNIAPNLTDWCRRNNPIQAPYIEISVFTLLLSYFGTKIFNFGWRNVLYQVHAIEHFGTHLEKLIKESWINEELILVTLKNNKWYIGTPEFLPVPFLTKEIILKPVFSGFRNERHELIFTTHYLPIYLNFDPESEDDVKELMSLKVILNYEDIISASPYSKNLYDKLMKTSSEEETLDLFESEKLKKLKIPGPHRLRK